MSSAAEVRCPYCLVKRRITTGSKSRIKCIKCARQFAPAAALAVDSDRLANIPSENESASALTLITFVILLLAGNNYVYQNIETTKGEPFIIGYALFGILCIFLSRLNLAQIKGFVLILFESIGIMRLWAGTAAGMGDFGFLVFAMFIGGLLIIADSLGEAFSSNGSNSDGGCGGGCGGGGCGGCG